MKLILFLDKCFNKLSTTWRKSVFKAKAAECGKNVAVYGKIYQIDPNIYVGDNVRFYPGVQMFGDGKIIIGNNVSIGNDTLIYASKDAGVSIGDGTQIAAHSYIIDTDHGIKAGIPMIEQKNTSSPIVIGKDVWIAANVNVLKGSKIGDGAVIGAKSLVKSEIPANAIAFGTPAKVVRMKE